MNCWVYSRADVRASQRGIQPFASVGRNQSVLQGAGLEFNHDIYGWGSKGAKMDEKP